jgi:hypothetical protein
MKAMDRRTFIQVAAAAPMAAAGMAQASTFSRLSCVADGARNSNGRVYPINAWDEPLRRFAKFSAVPVRLNRHREEPDILSAPHDLFSVFDIVGFVTAFKVERTDGPEHYKVFAAVTACESALGQWFGDLKHPVYMVPLGNGAIGQGGLWTAGAVKSYKFSRWEMASDSSFVHAEPLQITAA